MREGAKLTGTGIFLWGVAILVVIVLSAMALFGFGLFNRGTANFRGKNEQIEKTKANGNYRSRTSKRSSRPSPRRTESPRSTRR
jgi:hypothetical protein